MIRKSYAGSLFAGIAMLLLVCMPVVAAETENGVTIDTARVFHGMRSGTRYYGWTGGRITLPSAAGGILSFNLWNDVPIGGTTIVNNFVADIGGQRIVVPNYATVKQIVEAYSEDGGWGAGGTVRVSIAVPSGISSFEYGSEGSQTGIEISELRFSEGYRPLSGGFSVTRTRDIGTPVIEVGRIFTGKNTGRKYYGWTGGIIHLPTAEGGFLGFKVWNDQPRGHISVTNKINIVVGGRSETFTQYTTSLDPEESYAEDSGWGPAGGVDVAIQIPEGVSKVEFNNAGSATGIEVSDVVFSKGSPVVINFKEKVRTSGAVLVDMGRVFTGASTGRKYYGWNQGTIILPNTKGGTLTFQVWNDHPDGAEQTRNRFRVKMGAIERIFEIVATIGERQERYNEDRGWGPSGGREVNVNVPTGIGTVEILRDGNNPTGIELSDVFFVSDYR